MGRYILQKDKISCGPVAIINALKWGGSLVTEDELFLFQFSCRTINPENPSDHESGGTHTHDFDRTLRYAAKPLLNIKRKKFPSFRSVKNHLLSGGAICIAYYWKDKTEDGFHFAFIEQIERGCWLVINDHEGYMRKRSDKTIRKWFSKKEDCPTVWFLKRK